MNMEFGEAKKCIEAFKAGTASAEDAIKELGHLAAAATQARVHMMKVADEEKSANK